jgi:hypothetical protein
VFLVRYELDFYGPYDFHNKQRLFPVFPVRYGLDVCVPYGSHYK